MQETNVIISLDSSLKGEFTLPLNSSVLPCNIKERYLNEFETEAYHYFTEDYYAYRSSVDHLWIFGEKNLFETLTENEQQDLYFKPDKVDKVFYFENGVNDEKPWKVIGSLKGYPEIFFYFDAWCDYTGFDCQGGVIVRYAKSFDNMLRFGLTEELRDGVKGISSH